MRNRTVNKRVRLYLNEVETLRNAILLKSIITRDILSNWTQFFAGSDIQIIKIDLYELMFSNYTSAYINVVLYALKSSGMADQVNTVYFANTEYLKSFLDLFLFWKSPEVGLIWV